LTFSLTALLSPDFEPSQAQADPLQLLACLAPPETVQAAASLLPHLGSALQGGVSDLYTQAKKKLLKVGVA